MNNPMHECGPLCEEHGDARDTSVDWPRLRKGLQVGEGQEAIVTVVADGDDAETLGFLVQQPDAERRAERLVLVWNSCAEIDDDILEALALKHGDVIDMMLDYSLAAIHLKSLYLLQIGVDNAPAGERFFCIACGAETFGQASELEHGADCYLSSVHAFLKAKSLLQSSVEVGPVAVG